MTADSTRMLTTRALLLGAVVGAGLGVANLVFSLKTGLSVGVALTAVTLAAALRKSARVPFTLAEGTATQSVASAAGYSTGSTLASSTAAWVLLNGEAPPVALVAAWTVLISVFGCLLVWPLRPALVELPFPSGAAAAHALRALWEEGREAVTKARALLYALAGAAAVTLMRDGTKWLPATLAPLERAARWGFGLDVSLLALGAGALLGTRLALSLLLGATVTFAALGPWWAELGWLQRPDLGGVAGFAMWPGAALFAGAALVHFAVALLKLKGSAGPSRLSGAHAGAALAVGVLLVVLARLGFGVPWAAAAAAVALALPLCVVSARVTGETDVTPGGPLGQLTQVALGPLTPGAAANAMGGGLTAGAAASAADLMSDLKTGAVLGVDPRRQLAAQLLGCVVGGVLMAPVFVLLVPAARALGPDGFPVPAAQVFAAVGRVLAEGSSALPAHAGPAALVALVLGVALALLEVSSKWAQAWLPSPTALGLSMLLPPSLSLAFALGAALAFVASKRRKAAAEAYAGPVAAGLIAGESLAGAAVAIRAAVG